MIEVREVSKCYGAARALDAVSFEIAEGEVVGFLGLNGAGKTTMLKILSGAIWPSAGDVRIGGYNSLQQAAEVRRLVGFLPDRPPLYGDMTVDDMLRFAARLNGVRRARLNIRLQMVIELCDLGAVRHQAVASLSLGYRQRVGIAQAIIHQPALLILDEPISGLDPQQIVAARQLIRRLKEAHTVLLSSHILGEISQTCDRLLLLHQGRIVASGGQAQLQAELGVSRYLLHGIGDADTALNCAQALPEPHRCTLKQHQGEQFTLLLEGCDASQRAALSQALVQAGLGISELSPQREQGLEALFLQLTQSGGENS